MMTSENILSKFYVAIQRSGVALGKLAEQFLKAEAEEGTRWLDSLPAWPGSASDIEAVSNAEAVLLQFSRYIRRFPDDASAVMGGIEQNLQAAVSRRDAEEAARLKYIKTRLSRMAAGSISESRE